METEQKIEMPDPLTLLDKILDAANKYPHRVSTGFYTKDGHAECIVGVALNEGLEWPIEKLELLGTKTISGLYQDSLTEGSAPRNIEESRIIDAISCIQDAQDNGCEWKQSYLEGVDYLEWLETDPYGAEILMEQRYEN